MNFSRKVIKYIIFFQKSYEVLEYKSGPEIQNDLAVGRSI